MKTLGYHMVVELSQCNAKTLCNLEKVEAFMVEAAKQANAQVLKTAFHQFGPLGISGVVIIAESHLSIHTWPEWKYHRYAAIDIYTCGEKTDPRKACDFLAKAFEAKQVRLSMLTRGIQESPGLYSHTVAPLIKIQPRVKTPASRKELKLSLA